jgi:hypothetical protein
VRSLSSQAAEPSPTAGITVSDIVIDNGKPIVVGPSKEVEPPIRILHLLRPVQRLP